MRGMGWTKSEKDTPNTNTSAHEDTVKVTGDKREAHLRERHEIGQREEAR